MGDGKSLLADIITDEIWKKGPIPFSRYMELCLYHPTHGYYERDAEVTGRLGDFFTSPHVHRLFGETLARWMRAKAAEAAIDPTTVLELGSGNGLLAQDLMDSWKGLGGRDPLLLLEASSRRRKTLSEGPGRRGARILRPEEFASLPPFDGFIVANEFFDALPARVVSRTGNAWSETLVTVMGGGFIETLKPLAMDSLDTGTRALLHGLPDGHRAEYAPEARAWLGRLASKLRRGFVLILDYGDTAEMMSAPWRGGGTLRCFSAHRIDADPFDRPGEKDITASVNFSLLQAWAREVGFSVDVFTTQSSFLVRAGILDLMTVGHGEDGDGEPHPAWASVKTLIMDEGGMGEAFKVMVLRKG